LIDLIKKKDCYTDCLITEHKYPVPDNKATKIIDDVDLNDLDIKEIFFVILLFLNILFLHHNKKKKKFSAR